MIEAMLLEVSFKRIYEGPRAHEIIAEAGRAGFRIFDIATYAQSATDGSLLQSDMIFVRDGPD